jgi:hypothetical protein
MTALYANASPGNDDAESTSSDNLAQRLIGRPPGPTKLTPELMRGVFHLVRAGLSLDKVAYAVGIDPTTFYRWMREGRRETEGLLYEFFTGVKKALAAFEYCCIEAIPTDPQWQRRAWLLERKFPDQWGRREPRVRPPREKPPESMDDVMREIRQVLGQDGGEVGDGDEDSLTSR